MSEQTSENDTVYENMSPGTEPLPDATAVRVPPDRQMPGGTPLMITASTDDDQENTEPPGMELDMIASTSNLSTITEEGTGDEDLSICISKLHFYGSNQTVFKDPQTKEQLHGVRIYIRNLKRKIASINIPARINRNEEKREVEEDLVELRKLIKHIQTTPDTLNNMQIKNDRDKDHFSIYLEDDLENLTILAQSRIDSLRGKLSDYRLAIERLERRSGKYNTRNSKNITREEAIIPPHYFNPTPDRYKRTRNPQTDDDEELQTENNQSPLLSWENPDNFSESISGSDSVNDEDTTKNEEAPLYSAMKSLMDIEDWIGVENIQSGIQIINSMYKLDLSSHDPQLHNKLKLIKSQKEYFNQLLVDKNNSNTKNTENTATSNVNTPQLSGQDISRYFTPTCVPGHTVGGVSTGEGQDLDSSHSMRQTTNYDPSRHLREIENPSTPSCVPGHTVGGVNTGEGQNLDSSHSMHQTTNYDLSRHLREMENPSTRPKQQVPSLSAGAAFTIVQGSNFADKTGGNWPSKIVMVESAINYVKEEAIIDTNTTENFISEKIAKKLLNLPNFMNIDDIVKSTNTGIPRQLTLQAPTGNITVRGAFIKVNLYIGLGISPTFKNLLLEFFIIPGIFKTIIGNKQWQKLIYEVPVKLTGSNKNEEFSNEQVASGSHANAQDMQTRQQSEYKTSTQGVKNNKNIKKESKTKQTKYLTLPPKVILKSTTPKQPL